MNHDTDTSEVLSDLLDGERVRPHELADALATPEGVATLVDFVSLRQAVTADLASDTRHDDARATVRARPVLRRVTRVAAAIVLLVLGAATATWLAPGRAPVTPLDRAGRPSAAPPTEAVKVVPAGSRFGEPGDVRSKEKLWS